MELVIVIIVLLLMFGSLPVYPYSQDWGYRGPGILGILLVIVLIFWLFFGTAHLHRI
jgi:hypothetical protein